MYKGLTGVGEVIAGDHVKIFDYVGDVVSAEVLEVINGGNGYEDIVLNEEHNRVIKTTDYLSGDSWAKAVIVKRSGNWSE